MKTKSKMHKQVLCAMIAAVYAVISLVLSPLSFGNVQVRIAEALTLLPVLFPEAIWAVTLGCALTNAFGAMMGVNILGFLDVFVGTLATCLAAVLTYKFRNIRIFNLPILSMLMPVIFNGIIIGAELSFALNGSFSWPLFTVFGIEVALGELASCAIIGLPMIHHLEKRKFFK